MGRGRGKGMESVGEKGRGNKNILKERATPGTPSDNNFRKRYVVPMDFLLYAESIKSFTYLLNLKKRKIYNNTELIKT